MSQSQELISWVALKESAVHGYVGGVEFFYINFDGASWVLDASIPKIGKQYKADLDAAKSAAEGLFKVFLNDAGLISVHSLSESVVVGGEV